MAGFIFIGIFIFSAIFALAAFVFGHDGDHDVGGDHDVDHGDMPSIFSTRVISLFLVGFGGMGIIAYYVWKFSAGYSSLCGVGAGVILGAIAYVIIAFFYREQASSGVASEDYVDMVGRISSAIPAHGSGEISVVIRGQLRTVFASTSDGSAVPEGRSVKILSMAGGSAIVAPPEPQ